MTVEPLKSRTMTLNELQLATLDLIRKVRFQLNHNPFEEGMSDKEFDSEILCDLETVIIQDRQIIKMHRAKNKIQ